jgi:hypothetical protein
MYPLCGSSPSLLYAKGQGLDTRERERERSPGSLSVVPTGPVDDDGGVPAPLPSARCNVHLNKAGGTGPPACLVGDVHPNKMGGMSPRRVLRLDLQ